MEPLDLDFELPPRGSRDILGSLHRQLRAAIIDGRLRAGSRLPATRAMADGFGVSRNTVMTAYELLLGEGYLESRRGSGTFVATSLRRRSAFPATNATSLTRKLHPQWRDSKPFNAPSSRARFDFRAGYPDQRLFPFDVWRRLIGRELSAASRTSVAFGHPQGDPRLRAAISQHVSVTRAVASDPEAVIVTSGAQQAFDLLARVLVTPGRTIVALENPGYMSLRAAFSGAGARVRDVPLDAEGLRVDRLPRRADVICVAPSHQFPLGMTMSAARRAALLERAHQLDAVVIEDDYDGEFRLSGRALDALQTIDRDQRVIYVGTFSKSLFPGIRVGYIVAPPWARRALVAAKQTNNWHVPAVTQATLAAFITERHLARHVRTMRAIYADRYGALMQALPRHLGHDVQPLPSLAGMHVCAALMGSARADQWVRAAAAAGIRIESLDRHTQPPESPNGLIFGFGLIDVSAMDEAVGALAHAARQAGLRRGA